jgi:hypothetical protein
MSMNLFAYQAPQVRAAIAAAHRLDVFRAECRRVGLDPARLEEAASKQARTTTLSFWESLQWQADAAGLGVDV